MSKRIASIFMALIMAFSALAVSTATVKMTMPEAVAEYDEDEGGEWISAWGTGVTDISFAGLDDAKLIAKTVTIREIFTPTASGDKIRLKLSNKYGKNDLVINRMTIGKAKNELSPVVDRKTIKQVYHDGGVKLNFVIPAGEEAYTDPIDFDVNALEPLAFSFYLSEYGRDENSGWQSISTMGLSGGTSYLSKDNMTWEEMKTESIEDIFSNLTLKLSFGGINVMPVVSSVDVLTTQPDPYTVVVAGDSTVSNRFPEYIAKRINAEGYSNIGVVSKSIYGNSLISEGMGILSNIYGPPLLDRLEDDVFSVDGVRYVVVKIGMNDIILPVSTSAQQSGHFVQPTSEELIDGYKELIERCHERNIKVIACSITQWKGTSRDYFGDVEYVYDDADWQIAEDVNSWLSETDLVDGYIDLVSVSASPKDPQMINPVYTSDLMHPNEKLQQLWAEALPLIYLGIRPAPTKIVLNMSSVSMQKGDKIKLSATVYPIDTANPTVAWSSSDTDVVTVTRDGFVTAVGNGSAKITCTSVNGIKVSAPITVSTPSSEVILSSKNVSLYEGQSKTVTASILPADATDTSVRWSSSDEDVATVSSNGKITAVGVGTAVITCTTNDTGAFMTCKVSVTKKTSVNGVSLNTSKKTVYTGKTYKLKATVSPANASNSAVTWSSSNSSVATVSSSGLVTAKKNGSTTIIVTTKDGKYTDTCKITVKTKVSGISISSTSESLYVGEYLRLKETVKPSSATNKAVKWKSSDKSVATVSSSGLVTAKNDGTAIITCTTEDGSFIATCKVKVTRYINVEKVVLSKSSKTLYVTDEYTLKASVAPSNASNKSVTWKSSNSKVAKVSSKGVVTAVAKGTATITCTSKDGSKKATCKITVKQIKAKSVKISKSTLTVNVGSSKTLTATVSPANASNQNVTWSSSNKDVAKVSSTGKVTGVGPGTATITCKTKDGGFTSKCKVTVKKKVDPNQKVMGIKLSKAGISLEKNKVYQLTAQVIPANAGNQNVTWSSSNPKVAFVSSKGVVIALSPGETTVSARSEDGGYISTCKVIVVNPR